LTIIDGVQALQGEGPERERKRNVGLIAAGSDCVSIDSILALIMGLKPEDIMTTKEAAQRKLGEARIAEIQILGEKLNKFTDQPFRLPVTTFKYRISQPIISFAGRFIRFYPVIDLEACSRCRACIEICPQRIIQEKDQRITIDYSGCIFCFCCQEACPNAAISVKRSLLVKLLRL
jgi:Pyruvate/2-oxoacid:ferredoxin oxidoreductase delta subunit